MSDNGKKFEFGYDSSSDSYGYYKNGSFTVFGGGSVKPVYIFGGMGYVGGTQRYFQITSADGLMSTYMYSGVSANAPGVNVVNNDYLTMYYNTYQVQTGYGYFEVTVKKDAYMIDSSGAAVFLEAGTHRVGWDRSDTAVFDGKAYVFYPD